ncbi:hypothetical protein M9Y10_000054 [Tritrichomonas musculus]|uniref:Uncharacterized protein n=1 Tax=Tritrichomonas musculus TaxID=1915356 RepID=A0ABR2L4B5_9EUKA
MASRKRPTGITSEAYDNLNTTFREPEEIEDEGSWSEDGTSFLPEDDGLGDITDPYDTKAIEIYRKAKGLSGVGRIGVPNRKFENIVENLEGFKVPSLSKSRVSSKYKQDFIDMIINGNCRIKYIPAAAKRDTAIEYCLKHTDENGIPKYRVLQTNTTDLFGNKITDLNGDKVDDIVLVNKKGVPVIVNGYQLVQASPYKKVWAAQFNSRELREANPFNIWLAEQFQKSVDKVDWEKGIYQVAPTEQMSKAMLGYGALGLPKARVSKRLSPRSYWTSAFKHIWDIFWIRFKAVKILQKATNFLAVSNFVYSTLFDIPALRAIMKQEHKTFKYDAWSLYKSTYKSKYNDVVKESLTEYVTKIIPANVNKNSAEWDEPFKALIAEVEYAVFNIGLHTEPSNTAKLQKYMNGIAFGGKERAKAYRDAFMQHINEYLEKELYNGMGYMEFKAANNKAKDERKAKAGAFMLKSE